jgi:hypothetical protein
MLRDPSGTLIWVGLGVAATAGLGLAFGMLPGASLGLTRATMATLGVGLGLANTAASTMFFRTIGGAIAVGALGAIIARDLGANT